MRKRVLFSYHQERRQKGQAGPPVTTQRASIPYLLLFYGIPILLASWLWGCANPAGSLTGGAKDITPPKLDSLASTPSPSTNFKERKIVMAFNEWLKLENVAQQVLVTPPLNHRPDIRLKGKSVIIEIDPRDTLRENTTYIINMGNAIKDLTEGNVPPNLKFVFSTGPEIDSLTLSGQVFDLESGKGVDKVLVMLYGSQADSVVRTQKPYYFAHTDEAGKFTMEYLKPGTYKAFALKDKNSNYLYDLPDEAISFLDSTVTLPDTTGQALEFILFLEEPPLRLMESQTRKKGIAKAIFNRPPWDMKLQLGESLPDSLTRWDIEGDTLLLWYAHLDSALQHQVVLTAEEGWTDSITFSVPSSGKWPALKLAKAQDKQILSPKDTFRLRFNHPVVAWDSSQMTLVRDSVDSLPFTQITPGEDPRILALTFPRKKQQAVQTYQMTFLPEAFTDLYGNSMDTLQLSAEELPLEQFGDISVNIQFPDSSMAYLVEFLGRQGEVLDTKQYQQVDSVLLEYKTLPPGNYQLRVVEDSNANGRKDAGHYNQGRHPERIFQKKLEELRKNWMLETKVEVVF